MDVEVLECLNSLDGLDIERVDASKGVDELLLDVLVEEVEQ